MLTIFIHSLCICWCLLYITLCAGHQGFGNEAKRLPEGDYGILYIVEGTAMPMPMYVPMHHLEKNLCQLHSDMSSIGRHIPIYEMLKCEIMRIFKLIKYCNNNRNFSLYNEINTNLKEM